LKNQLSKRFVVTCLSEKTSPTASKNHKHVRVYSQNPRLCFIHFLFQGLNLQHFQSMF